VKKSLNYSLKQGFLAAIACVSFLSACQQPPATTPTEATPAAKPTTTASESPAASASPSASPSTKPTEAAPDKANAPAPTLDKVVGEYKVVLEDKVLKEAEKEGIKSVTGKWIIKPEGTFETTVKTVSTKGEVLPDIKTAGKITIEGGKIVYQVESVNGEKILQAPQKQSFTLSADGKELQSDENPLKLVKE
jgi:hypothetical protein